MIARILGEGQWEVPEESIGRLNELDAAVEAAVEGADERTFSLSLAALLDAVRAAGSPLAADALVHSDLILPRSDSTIEEVRDLLSDDGLIPG